MDIVKDVDTILYVVSEFISSSVVIWHEVPTVDLTACQTHCSDIWRAELHLELLNEALRCDHAKIASLGHLL